MLILTIRTDKPEAEIGIYNDGARLAYLTWIAHRELAETIETKLNDLLKSIDKARTDLKGIVTYKGPGSFTGLRIGLTVANALAMTYSIPIVADMDSDWIETGIHRLLDKQTDDLALPFYGSEANVTPQKN